MMMMGIDSAEDDSLVQEDHDHILDSKIMMDDDEDEDESNDSFDCDVDDRELISDRDIWGSVFTPDFHCDFDDTASYYSLPATPHHRRLRRNASIGVVEGRSKDYASENETYKQQVVRRENSSPSSRNGCGMRRAARRRWRHDTAADNTEETGAGGGGGETGLVVITRPKGGRKALCMDMDEVKACRELGFELEHDSRLLHTMPCSAAAASASTTSSGGNSPLADWRISSPGDDPREVKARLKIWAQAVALASSSLRRSCF